MTRFRNSVLAIFFVVCAVPGLILSTQILPELNTLPEAKQNNIQALSIEQQDAEPVELNNQKIVIVSMSTSSSDEPVLEAIWGLFINFGERPNLIFKEIYSQGLADTYALHENFAITPEGFLDPRFITILGHLNVNWDGYILLDEGAREILVNWMTRILDSQAGAALETSTAKQQLPQNLCVFLNSPARVAVENTPPWEMLLSNGMNTDIPTTTITSGWSALTQSEQSPYCEIISTELN